MNKFLIIFAALTVSCGNTITKTTAEAEKANLLEETEQQKELLLGEFQKQDLREAPFSNWFEPAYESFDPQTASMNIIRQNISDYKIKVLMGTWCGDSRREVPKLIKLLDKANYNYEHMELVGVDYNKTTPSNMEEDLDVHHVPTIIFYKNGKEVNRFVEYSQEESIEEDIAMILSGKEYKNSYEN